MTKQEKELVESWFQRSLTARGKMSEPSDAYDHIRDEQTWLSFMQCANTAPNVYGWRQTARQATEASKANYSGSYIARMQAMARVNDTCADEWEALPKLAEGADDPVEVTESPIEWDGDNDAEDGTWGATIHPRPIRFEGAADEGTAKTRAEVLMKALSIATKGVRDGVGA